MFMCLGIAVLIADGTGKLTQGFMQGLGMCGDPGHAVFALPSEPDPPGATVTAMSSRARQLK